MGVGQDGFAHGGPAAALKERQGMDEEGDWLLSSYLKFLTHSVLCLYSR